MPKQIQWSIYEAVILLDGVLQYQGEKITRAETVYSVSRALRCMAQNQGQVINEAYRNTNGISYQIFRMESALAGYTITAPPTRLFSEVVGIYRKEPVRYQELLEEAKAMIQDPGVTNEEKVKGLHSSKGVAAASNTPEGSPALKATDEEVGLLEEQIKYVLKDECQYNKYGTTVTYLRSKLIGISAAEIKKILDSASWAHFSYGTWKYKEPEPEIMTSAQDTSAENPISSPAIEPDVLTIDFENIPSLVYTKPVSFSYFEELTADLRSWADLYVKLFSSLYEDYPHLLHIGASFTASGDGRRIEVGDISMVNAMIAPRAIATQEGTQLFLETNLSTEHLVGKIKFLLDLCSVDYENVIIKYRSVQKGAPSALEVKSVDGFTAWMLENGYALPAVRSYSSAIRSAEEYTKSHSYAHQALLTDTYSEAVKTADELFSDVAFVACNHLQHNRFRAAITKLLEYYGISYSFKQQKYTKEEPAAEQTAATSIDTAPFHTVLTTKFVRGFRLGSPLDMKKFRLYYAELNGETLTINDEEIETMIKASGIQYSEKVFAPDAMLSTTLREKLFDTIRSTFAEGKNAVYYEALFHTFSESFLDYYIYDAEMLKAYIAFYNNGEFHLGNQYISKDSVVEVNPLDEIRNYLIAADCPIDVDEICAALSHLPKKKVSQILGMNGEFVYNGRDNGKGFYFHVNILHLTDVDLKNISVLIEDAIQSKTFVSGNELMDIIRAQYPYILESNPLISDMGMRDALKYHLSGKFSFKGNIISNSGHGISMADVFGNYARTHALFNISELKNLAEEMNSSIYLDAVYDNSLRISKEQFVSKDYAQFRVEDTDRAIARFCTGQFMPIGEIREFGTFPDAGYPWTSYLLEHYVYCYSKKFALLHAGFNRDSCVGAIVRREANIESFIDLLAIALGESTAPINRGSALSFFVEQGYLARRNYSDIEQVLIRANTYRNRKGTN